MSKTTHDLGLKTSVQTFDAFVRCTLMGNQPWPQFQNGIRERSIDHDLPHNFSQTNYGKADDEVLLFLIN